MQRMLEVSLLLWFLLLKIFSVLLEKELVGTENDIIMKFFLVSTSVILLILVYKSLPTCSCCNEWKCILSKLFNFLLNRGIQKESEN